MEREGGFSCLLSCLFMLMWSRVSLIGIVSKLFKIIPLKVKQNQMDNPSVMTQPREFTDSQNGPMSKQNQAH